MIKEIMKEVKIYGSILEEINKIQFPNENVRSKAITFCSKLLEKYNTFDKDANYNIYQSLGIRWLRKCIGGQPHVTLIKKLLVDNGILEIDDHYSTVRHISKGYRFNHSLIEKDRQFVNCKVVISSIELKEQKKPIYTIEEGIEGKRFNKGIDSTVEEITKEDKEVKRKRKMAIETLEYLSSLTIAIFLPFTDNQYVKNGIFDPNFSIFSTMDRLTFDKDVAQFIKNYKLPDEDLTIDNDIEDDFIELVDDDEVKGRYSLTKALALAKERSLPLIQYRDKCYIDSVKHFRSKKEVDLKVLYKASIFDIDYKLFYGRRNLTNFRFDYNLTSLKHNIFDYAMLDGEKLVELDVANSQFAIFCYLIDDLDDSFVSLCQDGYLYDVIATKLGISRDDAKKKILNVAFGKVKKNQDDIRKLYPKTMKFIDNYKRKHTYQSFSNLLQITESMIMIDGLLKMLIEKGYDVLPVHDSIRCKESQKEIIQNEMVNFFKTINYKCKIRTK